MERKSKKRVTTLDIAQKAGVTKATVSYALNGTGSVSAALSKKIKKIADELGYRPNRLAMATRTGETKTIGLVLPDLTNPFFPSLAQSVQSTARKQGYSVFLVDCQNLLEEENRGLDQLIEHAVDGLIWCPTEDHIAINRIIPFPTVIIDRPIEGFDSVYADSYAGGQIQGKYILKNGHTKIGILSGPDRSPSAQSRREGLYSVIRDKCDIVWDLPMEYNLTIDDNVKAKILRRQPSCVVTANDTLAISLLQLYHRNGVNVPNDVSIIGFDDIDWARLVEPPLTTIRLPIRDIGHCSVDALIRRIKKPDSPTRNTVLGVSLIERGSFGSST